MCIRSNTPLIQWLINCKTVVQYWGFEGGINYNLTSIKQFKAHVDKPTDEIAWQDMAQSNGLYIFRQANEAIPIADVLPRGGAGEIPARDE